MHQEVFLQKVLLSASEGGVVLVSVIHLLEDTEHPLHLLSGHTVTVEELNVTDIQITEGILLGAIEALLEEDLR